MPIATSVVTMFFGLSLLSLDDSCFFFSWRLSLITVGDISVSSSWSSFNIPTSSGASTKATYAVLLKLCLLVICYCCCVFGLAQFRIKLLFFGTFLPFNPLNTVVEPLNLFWGLSTGLPVWAAFAPKPCLVGLPLPLGDLEWLLLWFSIRLRFDPKQIY